MVRCRPQEGIGSDEPGEPTVRGVEVRLGNWYIRPVGGALGCLVMIAASILLSVSLTICINALLD